ncbi:hypothetical protein C809_02304 [Lachnospiraceae bacterium MD335]|nr:hypothetical protein C809_02304 [Lachnospiraceae bacterium MD335]
MNRKNEQKIENANINNSIVLQTGGNLYLTEHFFKELANIQGNTLLLNSLIKEKIKTCSELILRRNIVELRKVIQAFLTYGISGIERDLQQQIRYYQFLVALLEKNISEMNDAYDLLEAKYLQDATYVKGILYEEENSNWNEFSILSLESQAVVLDLIFEQGDYTKIEDFGKQVEMTKVNVDDIFLYYVGLSLFNLQKFDEALCCLNCIQDKSKRINIVIVTLLAKALIAIKQYDYFSNSQEELHELYDLIVAEETRNPDAIVGCEVLIGNVKLTICLDIMPDRFYEVYSQFTTQVKDNVGIQFNLGLFYEMKSEYEKALVVYEKIKGNKDSNIIFRYLYCNTVLKKHDKVIAEYENLPRESITSLITSIWLECIKVIDYERFIKELKACIDKYQSSINDIYYLSLSVGDEKELFDKFFLDLFVSNLDRLSNMEFLRVISIVRVLLICEHINHAITLLNKIEVTGNIPDDLLENIFRLIYLYKRDILENDSDKILNVEEIKLADEKIAFCNWFINAGYRKELFIKEKINCLSALRKKNEMLKCSKELYEMTGEVETAINIIALLLENKNTDVKEYESYIEGLEKEIDSRACLAIASAYSYLGKVDLADFWGYKAIFFLNNKTDFEILKGYMALRFQMLPAQENNIINYEMVTGNTVITIQQDSTTDYICLDDEEELYEYIKTNFSLNAKHYGKRDLAYIRLKNKKVGEVISIDEDEYEIIEIVSREVFCFRYVLSLCANHPKETEVIAVSVDEEESPEALVKSLRRAIEKAGGKKKAQENLLLGYHFENNELGFPIEILVAGNYERYVDAVKMLLYSQNQALYAGEVSNICFDKKRIILTFPSLLIIKLLDMQDILNPNLNQIVIPKSLIEFVAQLARKATEQQVISPGNLIDQEDGTMVMIPFDDAIVELYTDIYELCLKFQQEEISVEERTDFTVAGDISADMIFSSLKIDNSQLDCLILAKKLNDCIYICDDLFLRKIAASASIHNASSMSFIQALEDRERAVELCFKLSKTNYIYIPIIADNMDSLKELWKNMLNGERKSICYEEVIRNMIGDMLMMFAERNIPVDME